MNKKWIWKEGTGEFNEKFMKILKKPQIYITYAKIPWPGCEIMVKLVLKLTRLSMSWVSRLKFIYGGTGKGGNSISYEN